MTKLMQRLPELLVGLAVVYYVSTLIVSIAAGQAADLGFETLPVTAKLKMFVIVFLQPLTNSALLVFAAGVLWRIDRFLDHRMPEMQS